MCLLWQGQPGPAGPKGQRGERVSLKLSISQLTSCPLDFSVSDEVFFCRPSVFIQGEPGYVIASPDANFVPGRKGEPGSSVRFFFFFRTLMELYLFTDHIFLTTCYRDLRDLPVCPASMDLQARSARRDQRGHLEYP